MTVPAIDPRPEAPLSPAELAVTIEDAVSQVIRGKRDIIRLLLTALVARGHVLIEDIPGVGKTTLARALATCVGGSFSRIQFTSDLLPSDILGISIYDPKEDRFAFKPGPIFANIVLADEINRTTPRTQSSLLEALNEGQVTVDTHTHPLDDPFLVIATQNPIEHFGTYPLPESQLDRFLLRVQVGYPQAHDERQVIAERRAKDPVDALSPVVAIEEILALQDKVDTIHADETLLDYVLGVVEASRHTPHLSLGVSTRGAIAWYRAAKASALLAGRDYCTPDDIKHLAIPVLAHRVLLAGPTEGASPRSRGDAEAIIADLLDRVAVPL